MELIQEALVAGKDQTGPSFDEELASLARKTPGTRLNAMLALAKARDWRGQDPLPVATQALAWMAQGDCARFIEIREVLATLGADPDVSASWSATTGDFKSRFAPAFALGMRRSSLMTPGEREAAARFSARSWGTPSDYAALELEIAALGAAWEAREIGGVARIASPETSAPRL